MSIQLFIGHSGQRLVLDSSVTSLDGLRAWVAQHAGIQARSQVLLTAQGKQVRQQTLLTETELFVFDSKLFASKEQVSLPGADALGEVAPYDPGPAPDTIANQNDLQAWQELFRLRKSWATALLGGCSELATRTEQYLDEEAVIARCLGAAVASLQQHIKSGEKKYTSVVTRADDHLRDQEEHVHGWERNLDSLRSVPARAEFARFLNPANPLARRSSQQADTGTLQMFVDLAKTRRAADSARHITGDLTERLNGLQGMLEDATKDTDQLLEAVGQVNNEVQSYMEAESEASQLRSEIDIVVRKISSDLEHVQSLSRTPQSAVQASKMALLHTRNYLPNLSEYCLEMNELIDRARERRQRAARSALEHMQTLSLVESRLSQLYAGIESFGMPEEDEQSFATLRLVGRVPSVYGQLLVESVRRREWVAKMKRDSAALQEEMATYQEEEEKRRKKWLRSVEDAINVDTLQSSRVLGIELSLQNEGGGWPVVTREELQEYLNILLQVYGEGPVAEDMDLAIKDLDKPTRKQIKHAKAFKNGSMHEAAFGDTSLMLRGDEQCKSLRDMNGRLEDELKGQKSRVRKLEDLLHRSTQMSRTSADMFSPQSLSRNMTPPLASSPQPSGELSRNGSIKHRRLSSTAQGLEEKKLARRVVDLEAELHAAKEEAKSRKSSDAEAMKQVEEAVSTKKDLMENMDAQQKEFAGERRNLEAELRDAREKLEEAETEIERLVGSRDDERSSIDGKVATLEEEVARLKEDAAGHAARAANEHDVRNGFERKLEIELSARASIEEEMQRMKMEREELAEAEAEQLERLTTTHAQLSPDSKAPNGLTGLAAALEELSRRSASHARDLAEAVLFAKSENETLRASNEAQKSEIGAAKDIQSAAEEQIRQIQDRLATEEAKSASINQQLEDEQNQLRSLRNKFAEGETGSEVLRQRVSEEEAKVVKLSSQLAESHSHANSLDVELTRVEKEQKAAKASAKLSFQRLEERAGRAKEISQKLYSEHARFSLLLERLGLAVTYHNDVMVVERASKLGASTSMTEQGRASMITSPPPTRKSSNAEETMNLSILRWAEAQSAEDETAQYANFLENMNRFNVETFADAVVKRVRDFEYTARKYNKEQKEAAKRAEAYKDRAQRLKSEAHSKIAVKDFKEGDMALFLPTRGQAKGAWAAFNIGCPHYFLAEREGMRLGSRDFIVARITKVEQKVVDLSKTLPPQRSADNRSIDETSEAPSFDDDNPFELSDGLTWWMVHATEERGPGAAPTTPGLGKSTVAAANVDARGSIKLKRGNKGDDASRHLNKSLDSRRSSSTSKKGIIAAAMGNANASADPSSSLRPRSDSQSSLRPPPGPAAAPPSGLGIATPVDAAAASSPPKTGPVTAHNEQDKPALPTTPSKSNNSKNTRDNQQTLRPRSESPSKSVRSLQRHLDRGEAHTGGSPAKTSASLQSPSKQQHQGARPGWESLWSAEFSLESPGKNKK